MNPTKRALKLLKEIHSLAWNTINKWFKTRKRSSDIYLLPWSQLSANELLENKSISTRLIKRHGLSITKLDRRQPQELQIIVTTNALVTEHYGVYDRKGLPFTECFYLRAGIFIHGAPQKITPPRNRNYTWIPYALYLNNIELEHFGHMLTDGCGSIYPLLLWSKADYDLSSLPIVINSQLRDRAQELIDLFADKKLKLLIPTINTECLLVKHLISPVPSMLNGGIIKNGGYVNRFHSSIVKALLSRKTGQPPAKESLDKRGLDSGSEQEAWFLPLIAPDAIF